MTYSTQRELRRQLYMARNTEGTHDNTENNLEICKRLINLRREIAQLLGYETYADYVLVHRMASNAKNVYKLLNDLIDAYQPTAVEEVKALEREAKQTEGDDFVMEPWDFSFYSHKLQMREYNLDAEMLRPYFELSKVIDGVFGLATRLYGITFKENKDIQVYHPDVKAYEVFDKDGSFLAVFYADFHPRKGKQGGAWMTEFQGQWIDRKGVNVRPHVSVVMNLTKPTDEKPALLTLGEVETFLHEFGHSLHGMFANTRFESLSGTNVWWDFVELPSQFMENYSVEKEFLRTFAFHYKTGEPMPDDLIERIVRSRNFMAAYACLRQVSFGLLDMAYYTQKEEFAADIIPFEKKAWEKAMVTKQLPDTCMTTQFSHIMAGGGARCRCIQRVQEERHLRPEDGTELPRQYTLEGWHRAPDDALQTFPRTGANHRCPARTQRHQEIARIHTLPLATSKYKQHIIMPTNETNESKQLNLDLRYLRMARIWAENSYCQRRKVGALVVKEKMIISDGYNGTPSGFENVCEDETNTTKPYVLHAEANAITKLARSSNNSEGATLYVTASPCIECAKLIIQAGIKRVIYAEQYRLTDGIDLLRRANIEVTYLNPDDYEHKETK